MAGVKHMTLEGGPVQRHLPDGSPNPLSPAAILGWLSKSGQQQTVRASRTR